MQHKDLFGNTLEAGNIVGFNIPKYKRLVYGIILKCNDKMIRVLYCNNNKYDMNSYYRIRETNIYPEYACKYTGSDTQEATDKVIHDIDKMIKDKEYYIPIVLS